MDNARLYDAYISDCESSLDYCMRKLQYYNRLGLRATSIMFARDACDALKGSITYKLLSIKEKHC